MNVSRCSKTFRTVFIGCNCAVGIDAFKTKQNKKHRRHCPSWLSQLRFTMLANSVGSIFSPNMFYSSFQYTMKSILVWPCLQLESHFSETYFLGLLNSKTWHKKTFFPWTFKVWPDFLTLWLFLLAFKPFFLKVGVPRYVIKLQYKSLQSFEVSIFFTIGVVKSTSLPDKLFLNKQDFYFFYSVFFSRRLIQLK